MRADPWRHLAISVVHPLKSSNTLSNGVPASAGLDLSFSRASDEIFRSL
jgi:hypothetical protein